MLGDPVANNGDRGEDDQGDQEPAHGALSGPVGRPVPRAPCPVTSARSDPYLVRASSQSDPSAGASARSDAHMARATSQSDPSAAPDVKHSRQLEREVDAVESLGAVAATSLGGQVNHDPLQ